jgi:hypothetical protein
MTERDRTSYESIAGSITTVGLEIATAREGDFDDLLNVCESILDLIERINEREAPL